MDNYEEVQYIEKPHAIVYTWETPEQSLVALKLGDILLSLAEHGYTECRASYINKILPSLKHLDRRCKVLDMLNTLVLTFIVDKRQIKVYEYVTCAKGIYSWAYTAEYVQIFRNAGIGLPYALALDSKEELETCAWKVGH